MKRYLVFVGMGIAIIALLGWGVLYLRKKHTKSFSPEEEIVFAQDGLKVRALYNRPYKKGRVIFGGLVPYNQVWRTGANEATIFETNREIRFENQSLPPGKYTLWTIPQEEHWTVLFNSEYGQWGIDSKGQANRKPEKDVLSLDVPVLLQDKEFEQFTITFKKVGEEAEMVLAWDKTMVALPFSYQ